MTKKAIIKKIDRAIKEAWLKNISKDYKNLHLLKEDTLKNSLYYHVRRKLSTQFLEDSGIRMFTEFNDAGLRGMGVRADLAIVQLSKNTGAYLGDCIKSIAAIVELKYGCKYTTDSYFYADIEKVKNYIKNLKDDTLYYLGFVIEKEYYCPNWLTKKQTNNWADKKLVVLSANHDVGRSDMGFYMQSCNGLNRDLD